ncbi:MAG: hypothetical protein ACR2LJ_09765 [Acidimicrobiales bacterium]
MSGMGEAGGWLDVDDIERWVAEVRVRDAVDARQRERWLRRQAEDEAAFAGLLLGLAERREAVVTTTVGGRHHIGRVEAVGADFTALTTVGTRVTLVSLAAVAAVKVTKAAEARRGYGAGVAADARSLGGSLPTGETAAAGTMAGVTTAGVAMDGVTMADVIGHAVERRPRVQVFAGAAQAGGDLRSLGADVVTLQIDGNPPSLAYLRLASVSEFSFLDSG